jgi:hypothetical protein
MSLSLEMKPQELSTAALDWLENKAYLDDGGNYRLVTTRRAAPWNKTVKREFKDVSDFHRYAHNSYCPGCKGCAAGWYK